MATRTGQDLPAVGEEPAGVAAALWAMLPLADGLVRPVSAIIKQKGEGVKHEAMATSWVASPEELAKAISWSSNEGVATYIQLNASRMFGWRSRAKDVVAIQAVLVDLDPTADAIRPDDVWKVWVQLTKFGIDPGQIAIIDSGRGVQLWVLLDQAPCALQVHVPPFLHALRAWGKDHLPSCVVDTSCSDLPRLARCPGTVNPKTGRAASILQAARPGPFAWLTAFEPIPPPLVASPARIDAAAGDWLSYWPYLTSAAQQFVLAGVAFQRHQQAFACAASLRDAGATMEVAISAVTRAATLCSPPLPQADAERCVANAYRKD